MMKCAVTSWESFAQLWKYHTTLTADKYYSYISQIVFNKAVDQKRRWAASNRYADFYRVIYADAAIEMPPELSETEQRIQRVYELLSLIYHSSSSNGLPQTVGPSLSLPLAHRKSAISTPQVCH